MAAETVNSGESCSADKEIFSELLAESNFNIWSAGGRGEPEKETLEAERKLSPLERKMH